MHIHLLDLYATMQSQLEQSPNALDESLAVELINRLRPADTRNLDEINKKFDAFVQSLLITPNAAYTLQAFILHLIQQYKQSGLYSDSGILSQDGFWNQLSQRMGAYVLPSLIDHKDLRTLIGQVFHQKVIVTGSMPLKMHAGISCFRCWGKVTVMSTANALYMTK